MRFQLGFTGGDTGLATWFPAHINPNLSLSAANRTATATMTTSYMTALSTGGKSSGKWYAEINPMWIGEFWYGVGDISASLTGYTGSDNNAFGYSNAGEARRNGVLIEGALQTYLSADILMVAVDVDNLLWWVGVNNVWDPGIGDPGVSGGLSMTGLTPTYVVASLKTNGDTMVINGSNTTLYTPPTGFARWTS